MPDNHNKPFARTLRRFQSDAEEKLWYRVRARRLAGYKFRRQYPIGQYVGDFVCLESRVIIELDGGQHVAHKARDEVRTSDLEHLGYRVVRFWNDDVLRNTDAVLQEILTTLNCPHPRPLPKGEGARRSSQPLPLADVARSAGEDSVPLPLGDVARNAGEDSVPLPLGEAAALAAGEGSLPLLGAGEGA